jgi:transposase
MKKQDLRKLKPEAQQHIRKLVIANIKRGLTHKEISVTLGISTSGISKIIKLYKEKGSKGIVLRKRGRPSEIRLTKQQVKQVKSWIEDKTPDQLKLPFALWTRDVVGKLIEDKFGVEVSRWTVGRYLKTWGFTPQKPIYKAYEQKDEAVKVWLNEQYPNIQEQAKKEDAVIYWGDETGMRRDHHAGRSYAPKGKTPVIKATGKRFKTNMISAISNRGLLRFMIFDKFNSDVFIKFLSRMIERAENKIILIVDGHPAHKTVAVKRWLEGHKNKIEVFYLPGYSPELNPDEYLNQDIKTNAIGKNRPINKEQMESNLKSFLRYKQSKSERVKAYFHAKHVKYAA